MAVAASWANWIFFTISVVFFSMKFYQNLMNSEFFQGENRRLAKIFLGKVALLGISPLSEDEMLFEVASRADTLNESAVRLWVRLLHFRTDSIPSFLTVT